MIFSFDRPIYLFLILLIPLVVFIHFLSLNVRKKKALRFANFSAISRIQGIDFFSKNLMVVSLNILIILALVFALSGANLHTVKSASDFSYIIALDSSNSMNADDFYPNRFDASKEVIKGFIDDSPLGVRIGLVSFSGSTLIENKIVVDKLELKNSLDKMVISEYGGTDLYEALVTSNNLLINEAYKSVVIVSDGQFNVGSVDEAVNYALGNDLVVHTIAIGTSEGGNTGFYISKLDEDSLKSLSYSTGGEFYSAIDRESERQAFENILELKKARVSIPLSSYLLLFAIALFVIEYFLSSTRYLNLI